VFDLSLYERAVTVVEKIKTFEDAFEEIERCRGSHFDPILADLFIEMIKSQ